MRMSESAHQVVITGRGGGATEWAERVNGGVKMDGEQASGGENEDEKDGR